MCDLGGDLFSDIFSALDFGGADALDSSLSGFGSAWESGVADAAAESAALAADEMPMFDLSLLDGTGDWLSSAGDASGDLFDTGDGLVNAGVQDVSDYVPRGELSEIMGLPSPVASVAQTELSMPFGASPATASGYYSFGGGTPVSPYTMVDAAPSAPSMLDQVQDLYRQGLAYGQDRAAELGLGYGSGGATAAAFPVTGAGQAVAQAVPTSLLDRAVAFAGNNALPLASIVGLGGLSILGGGGSSEAPASTASASPNKYANAPLPTYAYTQPTAVAPNGVIQTTSSNGRTMYAPPANYQHGKAPEFLFFQPQQAQAQGMARGGMARNGGAARKRPPAAVAPGGQDDRVPAVLAQDEYVVPADVVAHLGDGSSSSGGKRLDGMISKVRKHKMAGGGMPPRAKSPLAYIGRS